MMNKSQKSNKKVEQHKGSGSSSYTPSIRSSTLSKRQIVASQMNAPADEKIWETNFRLRVAHRYLVLVLGHGYKPSNDEMVSTTRVIKGRYGDYWLKQLREEKKKSTQSRFHHTCINLQHFSFFVGK